MKIKYITQPNYRIKQKAYYKIEDTKILKNFIEIHDQKPNFRHL